MQSLHHLTNPTPQAHRIIQQLVFGGARVFSRAFMEAYRQANASRYQQPSPIPAYHRPFTTTMTDYFSPPPAQ